MNTVVLPTTLTCKGCVESIKPYFNASDKVKEWKVDLSQPVKMLTATGEGISEGDVIALLQKAGHNKLNPEDVKSSELPQIGGAIAAPALLATTVPFWSDAAVWKRAGFNTLNCLFGCSIGDFGMVIFLQAFYPGTSMTTQMLLATITGLCTSVALETVILKVREQFDWKNALQTAFSMSFISMIVMELAMNVSDFMVTGGKASFTSYTYWAAFAVALVAGFLAPLPYNYFKLKKYNKSCH